VIKKNYLLFIIYLFIYLFFFSKFFFFKNETKNKQQISIIIYCCIKKFRKTELRLRTTRPITTLSLSIHSKNDLHFLPPYTDNEHEAKDNEMDFSFQKKLVYDIELLNLETLSSAVPNAQIQLDS